jgi:hypothetical protein
METGGKKTLQTMICEYIISVFLFSCVSSITQLRGVLRAQIV